MTSQQKAQLVIDTFPKGRFSHHQQDNPGIAYLDCDFVGRRIWLSSDEEALLRMLGAINVFAVTGGFMGQPLKQLEDLNYACCGQGTFRFYDDPSAEDTLPVPTNNLILVTA